MWHTFDECKPTSPNWYWMHFNSIGYPVPVNVFTSSGSPAALLYEVPHSGRTASVDLMLKGDDKWFDEPILVPDAATTSLRHPIGPKDFPAFKNTPFNVEPGYEALAATLQQALDRAQRGKGRQRHADGITRFTDQPMFTIVQMLGGPPRMLLFQAMKKMMESKNLDTPAAMNELLDAIIYTASCVMLYAGLSENREA